MDQAAKQELLRLLAEWRDEDEPLVESIGNALAEWERLDCANSGRIELTLDSALCALRCRGNATIAFQPEPVSTCRSHVSYELIFWRQGSETTAPPKAIYRTLNEGQQVPGLVALPIDDMIRALQAHFPAAAREPNGHEEWLNWVSADGKAGFEATWSAQHVRVDCRHVTNQDMNRIIDIAARFGCALYDPQVDERFTQP